MGGEGTKRGEEISISNLLHDSKYNAEIFHSNIAFFSYSSTSFDRI